MNNEEFLSKTGLTYYHGRAKTQFENKIEKIKVNGTEQTITNKEVNLPTAVDYNYDTSLLKVETGGSSGSKLEIKQNTSISGYDFTKTNLDSGYSETMTLASKEYVDNNAGAINTIKVNGTAQTITNKEVDLAVPRVTAGYSSMTVNVPDNSKGFYLEQKSGGVEFGGTHADGDFTTVILTDKNYVDGKISDALANGNDPYVTDSEVDTKIESALTSAMTYKGTVATVADLPSSGNKVGDFYNVTANGKNYAWDGSNWDDVGGTVDLSTVWQKSELVAITTAEIDELFV